MTSSFTSNKDIEKPANGDYPNSWNVPVNKDWDIIDKALGSSVSKTLSNLDWNLTRPEAQNQQIVLTGTLSSNIQIFIPLKYLSSTEAVGGAWIVNNATTGSFTITMYTEAPGSTGVILPQGKRSFVYSDGTNIKFADDVRLTSGNNGITVSGGLITLAVPVTAANGGTGQTAYTAGDILYATGATTLAKLGIGSAGQVLTVSSGILPSWATPTSGGGGTGTVTSVGLSGGVTGITVTGSNPITTSGTFTLGGTLNVASGGTGASTLTGYVKGNGTGVMTAAATIPSTDVTGLGTMSAQASSSVAITGGTVSGVAISSSSVSNASVVRINTSSALSSAEMLSVAAGASTDGVVSRMTSNNNFNFVGQDSSGNEKFTVNGNGVVISNNTLGSAIPVSPFTGGSIRALNSTDWALEAYNPSLINVAVGAVAARVNNVNNPLIQFYYNTTIDPTVGLSVVGNILTNGSSTSYNTTSDYRLKENVSDLTTGLSSVRALRPISYTWKNNPSLGPVRGFLAHEVQAVVPEAVTGEKDAVDKDGNIKAQGIDHSLLVPVLVAAIKELAAEVEALKAKLP